MRLCTESAPKRLHIGITSESHRTPRKTPSPVGARPWNVDLYTKNTHIYVYEQKPLKISPVSDVGTSSETRFWCSNLERNTFWICKLWAKHDFDVETSSETRFWCANLERNTFSMFKPRAKQVLEAQTLNETRFGCGDLERNTILMVKLRAKLVFDG